MVCFHIPWFPIVDPFKYLLAIETHPFLDLLEFRSPLGFNDALDLVGF